MKAFAIILIFSTLGCDYKKEVKRNSNLVSKSIDSNVEIEKKYNEIDISESINFSDTLYRYFSRYKIEPEKAIEISGLQENAKSFNLKNHKIIWKYSESSTLVNVNGMRIRDKILEGSPYKIDRIFLYNINGNEIITIQYNDAFCGGNCFSTYTFMYFIKTSKWKFFESSITFINGIQFYNFNMDSKIEVIVPEFEGDFNGPYTEKYSLFNLGSNGDFKPCIDRYGSQYSIKLAYEVRSPETVPEIIEKNWFEEIN